MTAAELIARLNAHCVSVRGAIRLAPDATHPTSWRMIIQGARPGTETDIDATGKPISVWEYKQARDPKTPAQVQQRAKMRAAHLRWRAMSSAERATYADEAKRRNLNLYQTIISALMRMPAPAGGVQWDAGAAAWDAGAAAWDTTAATWDNGAASWDAGLSQWND
jgi:hypothetical protein